MARTITVAKLNVPLIADTTAFAKQMTSAGKIAQSVGDKIEMVGKAALGIAAGGIAALSTALYKVGDMAVSFNTSMMGVNSVLKLQGEEFEKLQQEVLRFSTTTSQSAEGVALALRGIASMGFEAADSMEILRVAVDAAGNMMANTETTTRALTSTIRAFGLEVSDVTHVADVLETAANKSALGFEELTQSVGLYAGAASAIGVSFEETTAAMMTMTDAGYSVSQSATGLNALLTGLIKPTGELASLMDDLGYESAEAALKQEGLTGVMQILTEATGGSTEEMAELIPNIRGLRGVFALGAEDGKNFADSLAEVMAASDGVGEHARMAEIRHQSWQYQITRLKSDLETFGITIGNLVMPPMMELVGAARDLLPSFEDLQESEIYTRFESFSEELTSLFKNIRNGADPLAALDKALFDLGFETVGYKIRDLITQIQAIIGPIVEFITNNVELKDVFIALGIAIGYFIATMAIAAAPVILTFAAIVAAVAILRNAWENNFLGIQEKTAIVMEWLKTNIPIAIQVVKDTIQVALDWIKDFWAANGDEIITVVTEWWEAMRLVFETAFLVITTFIQIALDWIKTFWFNHGEAILLILQTQWEMIKTIVSNAIALVRNIMLAIQALIKGDWSAFGEYLKLAWAAIWDSVTTILSASWDNIKVIVSELIDSIKGFFEDVDWKKLGHDIIAGIADGITSAVSLIWRAVQGVAAGLLAKIKIILGIASPSKVFAEEVGKPMMQGWAAGIKDLAALPVTATAQVASTTINTAKNFTVEVNANYSNNQTESDISRDIQTVAAMMGFA